MKGRPFSFPYGRYSVILIYMEKVQLRFHRLFISVIMPLNSFIGIYSLLTAVKMCVSEGLSAFNVITLLESIVLLALIFCTFRGLIHLKLSSLISLIALMAVKAADNVWALVLSLQNSLYTYTVSALLGIVFSVLVSVYYLKRRSLFSREGAVIVNMSPEDAMRLRKRLREEEEAKEKEKEGDEAPEVETAEEAVFEYDCPRCGFHITDGAVFCPKCGCQTRKVNH